MDISPSGNVGRPVKVTFGDDKLFDIFTNFGTYENPTIETVLQSVQQMILTINAELPNIAKNRVDLQPRIANYLSQLAAFSSNMYPFFFSYIYLNVYNFQ